MEKLLAHEQGQLRDDMFDFAMYFTLRLYTTLLTVSPYSISAFPINLEAIIPPAKEITITPSDNHSGIST